MIRYAILGPVALCDGERRVAAAGRRQVGLLALLLVNANRTVSSDRLIDAVWGDLAPAGALKRLQVAIVRLRRTLERQGVPSESVLRTVAGGYVLEVRPGELDAELFETRVGDARGALASGDPAGARDRLVEALGLWRGPALAEVTYEQFAQPEIRRLEELRLVALETRVDCELQIGEHVRVIGELDALVAAHPGRERLIGQLMLALYRCGRQADALDVFTRTRRYLSGELGLEPGPALRALQAEILAQSAVLAAPAAVTSSARPRGALPRPLQPAAGALPFTGREQEFARLTNIWADFDAEARRGVVICGEAGIGKTRAAAELAGKVHDEGGRVLYGRCDEGLAVPYQPFVQAFRSLLSTLDVDQLRGQLGGLAPELSRLVPELTGLGSPAPADPESARFALFEAVVALLEVATAQQRTLLVIDDVQWAAPTTLLLLRHVIRSERPMALLLVVTYRSTELQRDGALAELLADLQRDNSVQRIALTGLDEQAIDSLLRTAVGPELADQAALLVARVHAETAGNPFFVRELVAHLLESDALGGVGDGPAPATVDIPAALRDVVCHRVARLSQTAQQLMAIASVAAGAIDVALLKSVHAQGDHLFDALDEAVAVGLLVESERAEFDFAHALVRQAIYDHLGTARRLHLHRRLGEALEARGDEHKHVEALAYHFAQLALEGETDKAITYAIAAGQAATARLAYEDAARHFQRGLDVLARAQQPDAQRHVDLLLGVGHSRWNAGESDEARRAFEQAADIAHEIGDAAAAADAALGFCGPFYEIGATSTRWSDVLLQRALAMLDERDVALRARLMGRLAAAGANGRGQHSRRALAYDALALARAARDKHALTDVLATCCWATRGPDDSDHHVQMARELTGLAEEVGDAWLLANGHSAMIDHHLEQGDVDAVLHETDELEQLAQTRNNRYARWAVTVGCAMLAFLRGQLEHSESLALEALGQWADRPQFATPTQVFGAQMIVLRAQQGRLHEILERTAANVEHAPEIPAWRCGLAELYRYLGDHERARHELEQLGDISRLPRDAFWLTSIASVGMVASYVNDLSRSRQVYELLLPYASTCVHAQGVVCTGSASRPLGMLATTLARYDEAELHFTRALQMNARIRSPLWTAHTQYEYARMLRLHDRPGDHDRADSLLATASATAGKLGLQVLSRRISAETYVAHAA